MAFIDQLGKMITNAGQETATKAKNLSNITKNDRSSFPSGPHFCLYDC